MFDFCRHNDWPWQFRNHRQNVLNNISLNDDLTKLYPISHTDIPRIRTGRLGAQVISVTSPFTQRAAVFSDIIISDVLVIAIGIYSHRLENFAFAHIFFIETLVSTNSGTDPETFPRGVQPFNFCR